MPLGQQFQNQRYYVSFLNKNQQEEATKKLKKEEINKHFQSQVQQQNQINKNKDNELAENTKENNTDIHSIIKGEQPQEDQNIEQKIQQQQSQSEIEYQKQVEEQYQKEVEQMHETHNILSKQINQQYDIPFKLYGWLDIPEKKVSYMGETIFAHHKLPKQFVLDHIYKIYQGTILSMAALDEEFLNEYCEQNFAKKLIQTLQNYREKGYKIEAGDDYIGIKGEPVPVQNTIVDMVLVRGLNVDREKNLNGDQYHKFKDIEDMGLVIYTPLNLTNAENFIDPIQNKTIYDPYKQALLRALVHIRCPLRIKIQKPNGEYLNVDDNFYTWDHLALFETQLKPPPTFKSFYKVETYTEWLGKFNFGVWKLADLDNWFLGNPLLIRKSERDLYKDAVFKGTKFDPSINIDLRNV